MVLVMSVWEMSGPAEAATGEETKAAFTLLSFQWWAVVLNCFWVSLVWTLTLKTIIKIIYFYCFFPS